MSSRPNRCQYVSHKDDPIASMFTWVFAGFDSFKPGARTSGPKPTLTTLALASTTAGHATLYSSDGQVKHTPGSLMVMLPELSFHEVAGPGAWKTHWLVLDGPLAEACASQIGRRATAMAILYVPGRIRSALFEACRLIVQQPQGWQWPWLTHVARLLDYVQDEVSEKSSQRTALSGRVRSLMARHLTAPLPLPEIARRLRVSPSTFCHQFRQEAGVPPGLTYRRMRIETGRQLLASGLSVKETSRELGFSNPFHFSRLFRRIEGIPPREFQRRHLQPPLRHYQAADRP